LNAAGLGKGGCTIKNLGCRKVLPGLVNCDRLLILITRKNQLYDQNINNTPSAHWLQSTALFDVTFKDCFYFGRTLHNMSAPEKRKAVEAADTEHPSMKRAKVGASGFAARDPNHV
jgi:hypothetical protein